MTESIEHIADYSNEPRWLAVSWKYADLEKVTKKLAVDVGRYNDALKELDAAGTSINNGKERIHLLKEAIAQMEKKQ